MDLPRTTTTGELAGQLGARLIGRDDLVIRGVNEIHHVRPGDLCFVDHPKYYAPTLRSEATAILIDREQECPAGKALLIHDQPFRAYNRVVWGARPQVQWLPGVHPDAVVGAGTTVAPGAVIGPNCRVGRECRIGPNVILYDGCTLGDRVEVGAGTVIGSEGFYYKRSDGAWEPWRSGGTVTIEDDVEIGPNCTIARGVSTATTIGSGSKLDAQVQVAHDCRIGAHCLIAAQVGIAGNTSIGDRTVIFGQVGIAQNLTIGEDTTILAKTGVMYDLEGGKSYFGSPAQETRQAFRSLINIRKLNEREDPKKA